MQADTAANFDVFPTSSANDSMASGSSYLVNRVPSRSRNKVLATRWFRVVKNNRSSVGRANESFRNRGRREIPDAGLARVTLLLDIRNLVTWSVQLDL